ncbi:sugar ABC transporter permease [Desmospora profundinema]|uniref:Xylose transport system permease protein XylH n=1 Tax=Desmospora profundinema TaxID=1571184 RepID=A0ABU1IQ77_9BACL|nr:sugar ABC transporter permease [Desmospora profundinema]MDR6226866.1 D-xylose transport system permease protein [Desmospora profundinema]
METQVNNPAVEEGSAETEKKRIVWFGKLDVRAYTMIAALLGIWIFFSLTNDFFLSPRNLSNLFLQMSVTSILAIGVLLVIVAGHIDLSVGSIVGLTGGIAAILQVWYDWNTLPAILVTLAVGVLIGLFQGWWVAYQAVPAFIVTLGGMMAFRGILMGITQGSTIAPLSDSFKMIGSSYLPQSVGWGLAAVVTAVVIFNAWSRRRSRQKYGFPLDSPVMDIGKVLLTVALVGTFVGVMNNYKGIPFPIIIVLVLAVLFTFIAKKTRFGRHIYAIGGNQDAARLSGIPVKRRVLWVFVLSSLLASVTGIVLTSRVNAATIGAGTMYELDAIAACVIGGTSLMGGVGTIFGAVIGALVMASLDNGMSIMNMESFWQYIVKGSVLIFAVWLDMYSRRRKRAAAG